MPSLSIGIVSNSVECLKPLSEAINYPFFVAFEKKTTALIVSGEDANRYLQGRLTQDINSLEIEQRKQSLLLTANGKIQGKFYIIKKEDSFLIICDPYLSDQQRENFKQALLKFKVADRVDLEDLSSELTEVLVIGQSDNFNVPSANINFGEVSGHLFIVANDELEDLKRKLTKSEITEDKDGALFKQARIANKIPLFGVDITEKNSATEIDVTELVSFSKGCYTGQELVEMSTARGRPPKELVLLSGDEASNPKDGIQITSSCFIESLNKSMALGFKKSK